MSTKRQFHFINSGRIKNSYKKNGDLACKLSEIGEKILATNQKAWVKIAEDEFLPVIIEKVERLNSQHLLKFKNVNSADDVEIYQYSELLLEQEIVEDDENHNYCIGFSVFDRMDNKIGKVLDVYEIPGNPLLLVEMDNKEVMIPIADEFILLFENENQKIVIQNYKELLEI